MAQRDKSVKQITGKPAHYAAKVRIAYFDILVRDPGGYSARHKGRMLTGITSIDIENETRRLRMIRMMRRPKLQSI